MATTNKPEVIVKAIGIVMMLCVCLLGIYAKHSIDLQELRIQKIQQEIDQLEDRFDDFLNIDRQIHSKLIEKMSITQTRVEMLLKRIDKIEDK